MSRHPMLKVTGAESYRLSNSPTMGSKGRLRGRTANIFP